MAKDKQTPGDKRMLQASGYFAEGKYRKADNEYAAAVTAYKSDSPLNTNRVALAVFTQVHLRIKGMLEGDASSLIQEGLSLSEEGDTPTLRRFHALFHLQAASHSRLKGECDSAMVFVRKAADLLSRNGEIADRFELHQEEVLIHLQNKDWESSQSAARGALDCAQHPEQRLTAQFLMAECKEASGDAAGALTTLERAEAIVFDHKIQDGTKQLKERRAGLIERHPRLDGTTDDSEWI
jgi:tetratricopeptide (TPR) repeat protein